MASESMTGPEKEMFDKYTEMQKVLVEQLSNSQHQAITDASDWPMLVIVGGMLILLIAVIYKMMTSQNQQLKNDIEAMEGRLLDEIKENRVMYETIMNRFEAEIDKLWNAFETCKEKCFYRKRRKTDHDE